jgi:hypothetical protein
LKRDEAIEVLKELLEKCVGLDDHFLELVPPGASSSTMAGYQIIIRNVLDEETINCIQGILIKHQLSCQSGSLWKTRRLANKAEPDTFIIFRKMLSTQEKIP